MTSIIDQIAAPVIALLPHHERTEHEWAEVRKAEAAVDADPGKYGLDPFNLFKGGPATGYTNRNFDATHPDRPEPPKEEAPLPAISTTVPEEEAKEAIPTKEPISKIGIPKKEEIEAEEPAEEEEEEPAEEEPAKEEPEEEEEEEEEVPISKRRHDEQPVFKGLLKRNKS